MFRRKVLSLQEVLSKALRENGLETPLNQKRLIDSWAVVVGDVYARYSEAGFIKNQTLFVKVSSPVLRQELTLRKTVLVQKLNASVGAFVIADIRFY